MHLHHATTTTDHHQNHHKLLVFPAVTPPKFHTIDCEAPDDGLTARRSFPFEVMGPKYMSIIASCNGLVCVGIMNELNAGTYSDLILWNPLTSEYKTLSKPNSHDECYRSYRNEFGLYHNSYDNDYKLIRLTRNDNAFIYSLKSDSWRTVDSIPTQTIPFRCATALSNEKLYFLYELSSPVSYFIVRFDTKTEKFTEIATPFGEKRVVYMSLMVVRGCVHFFVNYHRTIELWRLDGDGDWTKVATYRSITHIPWFQEPLHLMNNGKWLMPHKPYSGYLYKLDMKKHAEELCSYTTKGICIRPTAKYLETLVSPNQYIHPS